MLLSSEVPIREAVTALAAKDPQAVYRMLAHCNAPRAAFALSRLAARSPFTSVDITVNIAKVAEMHSNLADTNHEAELAFNSLLHDLSMADTAEGMYATIQKVMRCCKEEFQVELALIRRAAENDHGKKTPLISINQGASTQGELTTEDSLDAIGSTEEESTAQDSLDVICSTEEVSWGKAHVSFEKAALTCVVCPRSIYQAAKLAESSGSVVYQDLYIVFPIVLSSGEIWGYLLHIDKQQASKKLLGDFKSIFQNNKKSRAGTVMPRISQALVLALDKIHIGGREAFMKVFEYVQKGDAEELFSEIKKRFPNPTDYRRESYVLLHRYTLLRQKVAATLMASVTAASDLFDLVRSMSVPKDVLRLTMATLCLQGVQGVSDYIGLKGDLLDQGKTNATTLHNFAHRALLRQDPDFFVSICNISQGIGNLDNVLRVDRACGHISNLNYRATMKIVDHLVKNISRETLEKSSKTCVTLFDWLELTSSQYQLALLIFADEGRTRIRTSKY